MRIQAVALFSALTVAAQTPTFDVASVKVSEAFKANDKSGLEEVIKPAPNGLTMTSASMLSCIQWAYGVNEYQVSGPGWLRNERYDIAARTANPVSPDELRPMLQALLKERFKLELHREQKEVPVYALVVMKGGGKLEAAKSPGKPEFKVSEGILVFQNYSLAEWSEWASVGHTFGVDRPIVDKTGLTGRYDFALKVADSIADLKKTLHAQDPNFYNDALRALGLRLELRKDPAEVLVIDQIQRVPVGN